METKFCQSCAMPLTDPQEIGTEADGSKAAEYCIYCYKNGEFTEDVTIEQMIDRCADYLEEYNKDAEQKLTLEEAKAQMREIFPGLKRWSAGAKAD